MALTENGGNDMIMPVAPMYGNGFNGNSGWGGDGWWIILLFLCMFGGWGGGFGGMGMGGFAADGAMLYPWMNQAEVTTSGFQNLSTQNQITAVQSDLGDIQTQLCNGFGNVQQSLCNGFATTNATINSGFANAETADNARQMANMQQMFGLQTAMGQGFNQLGSQFADCCCENRLASADLKYTIATENCADRAALNDGIRDIIASQTAGFQSIKDMMYQDKMDAKNDEIAQLRQEILYARGQASQIAQNQTIVDNIYNRLDQCPVGTTPVYGRTPIFTCNGNSGCNCSGNAFFN